MKIKFLPVLLGVAALPVVAQVTPSSKIVSLSSNQDLSLPMVKRAKSQILQLDSAVKFSRSANMPLSKEVYTYESDRKVAISFDWNSSTKTWDQLLKATVWVDVNENPTQQETASWDAATQAWVNSYKLVTEWYSPEEQVLNEMYSWDPSTNSWIGAQQYKYEYSTDGDPISMITSQWREGWVGMMKQTWEYDQNRRKILSEAYMIKGVDWAVSDKIEFTYEANKRIEKSSDFEDDKWTFKEKRECLQDANGNDTLTLVYRWDEANSAWETQAATKLVKQYDARNNKLLEESYRWMIDSWGGYGKKIVREFDANGNQTAYEEQEWVSTKNAWEPKRKTANTYDANGYITFQTQNSWNGSAWVVTEELTGYYSVPTSINETSAKSIRVYVADGRIEAGESDVPMDVYNANGVKVANRNLAKGLYLVRLGDRSTKVIVK